MWNINYIFLNNSIFYLQNILEKVCASHTNDSLIKLYYFVNKK